MGVALSSPGRGPRAALRMVVLATRDLSGQTEVARNQLGHTNGRHDPFLAPVGLSDEIFTVGTSYLQLLTPLHEQSRVHRWLLRKGRDTGYLIVLQTDDADGVVQRAAERGVRVTFDQLFDGNRVIQLHAGDTGGVLVEIDEVNAWESWHWQPVITDAPVVDALTRVTCTVAVPTDTASRLAAILGVPHVDGPNLAISGRSVSFKAGSPDQFGVDAFELKCTARSQVGHTFVLCGTRVTFVA